MLRRSVAVTFVAIVMALAMVAAFADSVTGGGQTALSAALGFNIKSDRTGQLNYNADPNGANSGFSAHCDTWTSYTPGTQDGFQRVVVTGLCTDKDGNPLTIRASFVDRGTPGTNDSVCIQFFDSTGALVIHDHGNLTAGNITIHKDANNARQTVAEMTTG